MITQRQMTSQLMLTSKALKLPMIWQTRIKEAVGQAEVLIDPFHCGQHCVYVCYNADGTIDREGFAEHRWLTPAALAALPHGGPTRKALALLGIANPEPHRNRLRDETGGVRL